MTRRSVISPPPSTWLDGVVLAPIGFIGQQLPRFPQKIQGRHTPLAALPVPYLYRRAVKTTRPTHNDRQAVAAAPSGATAGCWASFGRAGSLAPLQISPLDRKGRGHAV
jgi:hypothetical protein